jgi:hypothetical protein
VDRKLPCDGGLTRPGAEAYPGAVQRVSLPAGTDTRVPQDHAAAQSRRLGEQPKYVDRDPHSGEEQSAYEKHCEKLSRSERPVPTPRSAAEAP